MKKIKITFLIFVGFLILVPLFRFNYEGLISSTENRTLATKSELIKDNKLNKDFFTDLNYYLEDRIGLKFAFKFIHEKLNFYVFQMENNYTKIGFCGKGNWLFYNGDNLMNSYFRRNLFSEEKILLYCSKVKNMQNWCEANGIKFIFFIAPNKNEIYSEFYPYKMPNKKSCTEQLVERLQNLGVNVIFPKNEILNAKNKENFPIYFERDTHWNSLGAYYGSVLLVKKIKELLPNYELPSISYNFLPKKVAGGDLPNIIGTNKGTMTGFDVKSFVFGKETENLYEYIKNKGSDGVITEGNKNLPRLVMFRDSFTTALEPYISPYFSYAEYNWRDFSEEEKAYVLEQKPDIVIFESVERIANRIFDFD